MVQKLHPMGQPTEGMMVAAVSRVVVGNPHAQNPHAEAGENFGMRDGRVGIFAEIAAHPGDALAAHHVIGINQFVEAGNGRDVSADDNGGVGRELAYAAAHLAHLAEIGDDAGDADNVVVVRGQLALEAGRVGKSSSVLGAEMLRWIIIRPQER